MKRNGRFADGRERTVDGRASHLTAASLTVDGFAQFVGHTITTRLTNPDASRAA